MSKQEFLYHLETLLMDLPREEREDALDYYEQYFEAAGPEREAEVIRELGSPERVSEMIHSGGSQDSAGRRVYERPVPPPRKSCAPLWIALGVIGVGFVLLLAVGFLSFAELRTENTVRYSTGNSGYFETGNLEAEMLSVTLPDGLWKNNGTITVGTAAFEMNDGYLAAGKLKASKALTISVKDGVISGDRLDSPEISIECHDGLVRGTLAGTQEEYGWQASVGDGILEIGDQRSWNSLEKDQGERRLELSVNDGAAKIEFEG